MTLKTLTPDQLRLVGSALWGEHWQAEMSRDWGVNSRTIRAWASNTDNRMSFPAARLADLKELARRRVEQIAAIAHLLED